MSIPLLRPNKAVRLLLALNLALATARPALPLTTDQEQNIEIDSNSSVFDSNKNTTTFTGRVIVTQGSIRITGDRLTVYSNNDGDIELLVMEGSPATYRQLPDDSSIHDEAQARRMEYHKLKNLVLLMDQARVTQANGSLSGDRIEYDSAHSRVKATSAQPEQKDGPAPGERVKIIIPAKQD